MLENLGYHSFHFWITSIIALRYFALGFLNSFNMFVVFMVLLMITKVPAFNTELHGQGGKLKARRARSIKVANNAPPNAEVLDINII